MNKRTRLLTLIGIALIALGMIGYGRYTAGRPAPIPHKESYFSGAVTYHRRVYYLPRLAIAHVLVVDTKAKGLRMLVTPPDHDDGPPLNARTTSEFMGDFGVARIESAIGAARNCKKAISQMVTLRGTMRSHRP